MNQTNTSDNDARAGSVAHSLREIHTLVQERSTDKALRLIAGVKHTTPKNIYVAGLEQQILRLAGTTNDDDAATLRDSLPLLIGRAIDAAHTPHPQRPRRQAPQPTGKSDRQKAIESLKVQYFAYADGLMRQGNYEDALAEVRRIQLLDPGELSAPEYIRKLEELLLVQQTAEMEHVKKRSSGDELRVKESKKRPAAPPLTMDELVQMTTPDFEAIIAKASAASDPGVAIDRTPTQVSLQSHGRAQAGRKKTTTFLTASAFLIVAAIGISYFMSERQETMPPGTVQTQQPASRRQPVVQEQLSVDHSVPPARQDSLNAEQENGR